MFGGNNPPSGTTGFGATTKPGGFSFGTPTASTGTTGGFSLGTPQSTASTGTAGFSFGGTPQTTASTGAGFSFGGTPKSTTGAGGFNLGGTSQSSGTGGLSLGGTSAASGSGTAGFSFGASAQGTGTPQASAAPSGFSLGGTQTSASSGFSLSGTQTSASSGFSLGGTSQPSGQSSFSFSGATSHSSGYSLGSTPQSGATPGSTMVTQAAASSVGQPTGFSLPKPAEQTTQATATPATGGFSLTSQPTLNLAGLSKTTQPAAAQPTASTGIFGGGLKLGTTASSVTTQASSGVASGFPFGAATSAAAPTLGGLEKPKTQAVGFSLPASTAASSAAPGIPTGPQKQMNYQQLEENINKWMQELENQEKEFLEQATHVNAWDRLLVENGEKITSLNSDMERVKVEQQKLDHELDFIKSQQRELEELLVPLEKSVEEHPNISFQQHADLERENTYQLSENIDAQLKRMLQDLKEIIEHLNTSNANQDNTDPIFQITQILNSHMDSLQWIDQNSALLKRQVEDISKQMETQRKEQERNFRLVYN